MDDDGEDAAGDRESLERRHKAEVRELEGRHRREAKKTMSKDAKAEFAQRCKDEETELLLKHRLDLAAATAGPEAALHLAEEEEHRKREAAEATAAAMARAQAAKEDEAAAAASDQRTRKLRVVADLYRIPKSVRSVFHAAAELAHNAGRAECTIGAIDLHRPMSKSQLKALLQQYTSLYALDDASEGDAVTVPPSDGLYKIAREASVAAAAAAAASAATRAAALAAKAAASTSATTSASGGGGGGGGGGGRGAVASKEPQAATTDVSDYEYYPQAEEDEEEEEEEEAVGKGMGGVVVAGVWVPTVDAVLQGGTKRVAGGSSIGGWGVDADKVWKPTALPPRTVTFAAGSKGAGKGGERKGPPGESEESSAPKEPKEPKERKEKPVLPTGPITVKRDSLFRCLLSKLTPAHTVTLPDGSEKIATGPPPSVDISVGVVRGNKSATAIRGLEELIGEEEMGRIRERLAKKFAASCSIGPCDHNPKILEIMVQGNLAREAREFLVESYGVPNSCITSSIGKGVKKKK